MAFKLNYEKSKGTFWVAQYGIWYINMVDFIS